MNNQLPINNAPEQPEEARKPQKPVCELFERQPNRARVWCNHCGRHFNLHKAAEEEETEPAQQSAPFSLNDPLRCADGDTFNAIYNGGNSTPFAKDTIY